jgi:hypothetical protein
VWNEESETNWREIGGKGKGDGDEWKRNGEREDIKGWRGRL